MADEENLGAEWAGKTDAELVGHAGHSYPNLPRQAPVVEMQRRLKEAIRDFNNKSGRQATVMIWLTVSIAVLTVAMLALACSAPKPTPPPPDSGSVRQSGPDEVSRLRLTEMCATAARQFWKEGGYEKLHVVNQVWGYFSHYNGRLRRCLVRTRLTTIGKGAAAQTQDSVADAFEGIDIANASNVDRADAAVMGDDVLSGTSDQVPHTPEWFKRLMVE